MGMAARQVVMGQGGNAGPPEGQPQHG
jgi:hypothetical protein